MNPAKCDGYSYIDFLLAAPRTYTCTEAARVQPDLANSPAHEALTRWLHCLEPSPEQRWEELKAHRQLTRAWINPTLRKWNAWADMGRVRLTR